MVRDALTFCVSGEKNSISGGMLGVSVFPVAAAMILRSTATIQLNPEE